MVLFGVDIGPDAIRKRCAELIDAVRMNPDDVEAIGIDDVSILTGQNYGDL